MCSFSDIHKDVDKDLLKDEDKRLIDKYQDFYF